MTIGEAIRAARKSKGFTQQKLAQKAGVYPNTIHYWEHDLSSPSIVLLICIADVLDVTLDELVGRNFKKEYKKEK
jgi:transcriptional regulator with XRE-family HTH domain